MIFVWCYLSLFTRFTGSGCFIGSKNSLVDSGEKKAGQAGLCRLVVISVGIVQPLFVLAGGPAVGTAVDFVWLRENPFIHPAPERRTAYAKQFNHAVDTNEAQRLVEETDVTGKSVFAVH